jgi:hypothetical protein
LAAASPDELQDHIKIMPNLGARRLGPHEYHLWEDRKLPDGKILIPGVVTHSTNIIEHPELGWAKLSVFAEGAALASSRIWKA